MNKVIKGLGVTLVITFILIVLSIMIILSCHWILPVKYHFASYDQIHHLELIFSGISIGLLIERIEDIRIGRILKLDRREKD